MVQCIKTQVVSNVQFTIKEVVPCTRGKLYTVETSGEKVTLLFLHHAIERMQKWRLCEKQVIETLLFPEEVIRGHSGRYIAQRRYGNVHILRAVYEYDRKIPVLVTVYFPHAERYFQGGKVFEDKILERG